MHDHPQNLPLWNSPCVNSLYESRQIPETRKWVSVSRLYPCKTKCYLQSPYLRRYTGVLGKYRFTSKMLFGLAFSITKGSNSTAIWFGPTTISASRELDRQIARLIKDARPDGSRSDHQIPLPRESSATVVYSNFIGVKWEKDFPTVAKLDTPSTKYVGVKR